MILYPELNRFNRNYYTMTRTNSRTHGPFVQVTCYRKTIIQSTPLIQYVQGFKLPSHSESGWNNVGIPLQSSNFTIIFQIYCFSNVSACIDRILFLMTEADYRFLIIIRSLVNWTPCFHVSRQSSTISYGLCKYIPRCLFPRYYWIHQCGPLLDASNWEP